MTLALPDGLQISAAMDFTSKFVCVVWMNRYISLYAG